MTAKKKNSSKKKEKLAAQAALPLKDATASTDSSHSKLIFQLKSELNRHQKRDREWKLLFSMLAHDLKEPLLTLEGFTQLLEESGIRNPDQKKYMKVIREAVGSLHLLIGSMQSITKLYHGPSDLVEISLQQVLDSVVSTLSEQIKRNRGKVILPKEDLIIKADPARVYQILLNLIANSLKYHKKEVNPEIRISYRKDSKFYRISVKDNGVGINQKDMERVFAPFTRLEEVMADGLGLGLSIVKKIAETMGGEIKVRSQQNKGSVFSLCIPRNPEAKEAEA